jgi:hypothetical protein
MYDYELKKEWMYLGNDDYVSNEFKKACELYKLRNNYRIESNRLLDEMHNLEINGLFYEEQDYIMFCKNTDLEYNFENDFKNILQKYEPVSSYKQAIEQSQDGEPIEKAKFATFGNRSTEEEEKTTILETTVMTEPYSEIELEDYEVETVKIKWGFKAYSYLICLGLYQTISFFISFIPLALLYYAIFGVEVILKKAYELANYKNINNEMFKKFGVKESVISQRTKRG